MSQELKVVGIFYEHYIGPISSGASRFQVSSASSEFPRAFLVHVFSIVIWNGSFTPGLPPLYFYRKTLSPASSRACEEFLPCLNSGKVKTTIACFTHGGRNSTLRSAVAKTPSGCSIHLACRWLLPGHSTPSPLAATYPRW